TVSAVSAGVAVVVSCFSLVPATVSAGVAVVVSCFSLVPAAVSAVSAGVAAVASCFSLVPAAVSAVSAGAAVAASCFSLVPAAVSAVSAGVEVAANCFSLVPAVVSAVVKVVTGSRRGSKEDGNLSADAVTLVALSKASVERREAAGNLLGTAKQFKEHWEQIPTAVKAVFDARAKALLATNALTAVATSGAQGNTEEEFAGSNGDE
ncbi:hypothetical protein BDR03DRAFT_1020020, partial [Suillus americanus]